MTDVEPRSPCSVLVVCTGNICRSPAAELLLRSAVGPHAGISIASAGTAAVVGAPVEPPMAALLRDRGVDAAGARGRQLDPVEVRTADLVLTMTARHRSTVVSRAPAAVRRTFTLREFADVARLLADDLDARGPAERLATLVVEAPRARALRASGAAHDDIEDPYGRSDAVFERVLSEIETAVDAVAAALHLPIPHAA